MFVTRCLRTSFGALRDSFCSKIPSRFHRDARSFSSSFPRRTLPSSFVSSFSNSSASASASASSSSSANPRVFLFRTQRFQIAQVLALRDNFIYLVQDTEPNHEGEFDTFCIDPSEAAPVLKAMQMLKWPRLHYILNTHHHDDHTGGNLVLKEKTGCSVLGSSEGAGRIPGIDSRLVNMEVWPSVSKMATFSVLTTPGHTIDHISFLFHSAYPATADNDLWLGIPHVDSLFDKSIARSLHPSASSANPQPLPAVVKGVPCGDAFDVAKVPIIHGDVLFCGDTLFSLGCGRLLEGTAEQLLNSIRKFMYLNPSTLVCCGHEYTERNFRFALSVDSKNVALQARGLQVQRQLEQGLPTVPSTLQAEMMTNPFFLVDSNLVKACENPMVVDLVQNARDRIFHSLKLSPGCSDENAFAALRHAKDAF